MTSQPDQSAGGAIPITAADLQPGDEVTIRMLVGEQARHGNPDFAVVRLSGDRGIGNFYVRLVDVVTHTPKPRPLALGDKVKAKGVGHLAPNSRIIAVQGIYAWIDSPCMEPWTITLDHLELDA